MDRHDQQTLESRQNHVWHLQTHNTMSRRAAPSPLALRGSNTSTSRSNIQWPIPPLRGETTKTLPPPPPPPDYITLTTPEGQTHFHDGGFYQSLSYSRPHHHSRDDSLPALLAEPPPTPTQAGLKLGGRTEGYSFVLGPGDDESGLAGVKSPFSIPDEYRVDEEGRGEEEDFISYWSFSSSSDSSSDTSSDSSDSDDDEEDEMLARTRDEMMDLRQYDGDPVRILCTDPNGLTSFPSLQAFPGDHGVDGSILEDQEEVDGAGRLDHAAEIAEMGKTALAGGDSGGGSVTMDLLEAVEAMGSEYAGEGAQEWWRSSSSSSVQRPLPSWAWLRSSNTFPKYRLGPKDLRHGPSKLRLACSAADEDGKREVRGERVEMEAGCGSRWHEEVLGMEAYSVW